MGALRKTADVIQMPKRLSRVTSQAVGVKLTAGQPVFFATVVGVYIESPNRAAVESCIQCQEVTR